MVAGVEEGVVGIVLAVVVLLAGGITLSGVAMLCCWKRQQVRRCNGERESAELDAKHQPWYLKHEQSVAAVGVQQGVFESSGGHPQSQVFQTGPGQVQYVADYIQQQHSMQDEYVKEQREDGEGGGEEEEEGEQFQLEESGKVGVGEVVTRWRDPGAQTSLQAQLPPHTRPYHHIPRPQSRLVRMSTTVDEMDDYIKMNPVGHVGGSVTLPLAARNHVPDFSQLMGDGRLCTSYVGTRGLEVREAS